MKNKLFKSGFCEKLKLLLIPIGLLIGSFTMHAWADADPSYFGAGYCTMDITYNAGSGSTTVAQNDGVYRDLGTVTSFQWNNFSFRMCKESGGNVGNLCGEAYCHYSDELSGVAANWTDQTQTNITWNYNNNSNNVQYEGTLNKNMLAEKGGGIYELRYCFWATGSYYYNGGCGTPYWKPGGSNYYVIRYTINPTSVSDFTVAASGHLSGSGTEDDPYILPHNGTLTLTSSDATKSNTYDERATVQYSLNNSTWGTTSSYTTTTISSITSTDVATVNLYARYHISDADGNGTEDDPLNGEVKTKTIYYKTAPWSIAGTMNSWNVNNQPIAHYSSGTGYAEIALEANNTYTFKVKNRTNTEWYGQENADGIMTYTSDNNNPWQFTTSGHDCKITTAGAGTYRFTWNSNDKQLTVTYPTSYTVTFGHGDHGTSVTASGSTSGSITSGQYVAKGEDVEFSEEHDDGYSLKGWYTTADGNTAVSTMSSGDNTLDNIGGDKTVYAQYDEIMRTVTVAYKCGGSSIHADGSVTNVGIATSKSVTAETITGYTFSTWSTLPSSVTKVSGNLTDATITITATANATITANYTLNSNELTWDLDGGSITSESGTYTAAGSVNYGTSLTAPTVKKDGYTFAGWSPSVASTMPDEDVTYTATWTENTRTVSFANDGHGTTSPNTDQTAVGVVTGIEISASNSTGYHFNTWTSSNGGTFEDDDATVANTTFYPTANTTLTASFTANVYNGTINKTTGTGDDGSYSVTYSATSLTPSAPTKAGYHVEGYYLSYNSEKDKCDNQIAEPSGALIANKSPYTNSSKEWIYDDDAPTIYANWEGNSHTLKLYKNDGTSDYASTAVTVGSNSYTISAPTRTGYTFAGFYTAATSGTLVVRANLEKVNGDYFDASSNWKYDDNVELYAHWTPVTLATNGNGTAWGTAANWTPNCVPTSEHDVTIAHNIIVSGSAEAKSVTISTGILTIASTGALEVAGAITNTDEDKLVVEPRGALIYSGSTNASVQMSMSTGWHLVALPVYGVRVSSAFAGKGVYTYAWDNTEKDWERRGYYDDLMGNEAILVTGSTGHTFSGALVSTGDGGGSLTYDGAKTNGDVNMFANNLTAPIKVSGITISGSPDGVPHLFYGSGWIGLNSGDVIPAMQGYAILASSGGGSFSYSYATAVRGATSPNAPLYAPRRTTSDILDHITIYVSGNEWKQRIRLYENEQFTDEIDLGYEALHMEGEGFAGELYAQAAEKMNILAVPDLEGTVIGFIPGEATNYTISFEGDGKGYYLNDNEAQQSTLIAEGNTYTFAPGSNNAARFIVSRTPINHMPTGVDEVRGGVKARKQMIDGVLYIVRDGRMYNAEGALVK